MNWEVPLLLGFLLLFSAWVSFPLADQYFFIDSHGIKHHILTPEKSDHDNVADNLTNMLFTRYENPWIEYAGINIIFVAGIFIILQQEPVGLYLRNRIWTLISFNLKKYSHGHLQNKYKVFNLVYRNRNNDLAMGPSLIFFNYKELKKSFKVFFIIFTLLILFSSYSQDAYAATAQFVDGSQVLNLSINCALRSTIATLNTSLPAASSSTPNIIIATTDYTSSDPGSEQLDVSSGLYRGGSGLSLLQYNFFVDAANEGNHYTYIYEDSTAGASPTYTIEGCASAVVWNAESKILAIQGLESSFTDGVTVPTSIGSFVDIETLNTDLTANDHIIIAQVQIDFDGTATIPAGNIELRNSAGIMLAENQFEIRGQSGAIGDGSAITLIAVVPAGSANTSYKVAVQEPSGGGVAGAEAKILAIKPDVSKVYFSDGGSVAVGTSATQLTSLTSSFTSNQKIVVMSASQFDDTDGGAENLVATSGHEIRENSVAKSGNEMVMQELAASGNAGEGLRHTLIWYGSAGGASLGYDSRATASATGYNGESKLLAFSVQENLFPSDTPILSESVTLKQKLFPSDTPTLSETILINQDRTATDTPTLSETVVMTKIIAVSDTPTLSESVTLKQNLFPSDTPTLSDSATVSLIHSVSASDAPILSESVTLKQNLFPSDTPTLSETVTVNSIQGLSTSDTPSLSESVTLKQSLFPSDTPILNDVANVQNQSNITIIKNAVPNDAQDFAYTVSGAGLSPFSLDDDAGAAGESAILSNTQSFTGLASGAITRTITETLPVAGWDPTGLSCASTLGTSVFTTNTATGLVSITTLGAGDTVTCTYTNTKQGTKSGGISFDIVPPSIGSSTLTSLGDAKSGPGVIIGENNSLDNLSQVRPIKVGEKINLRFDVYEDQGINSIAHASLYIGKGTSTSEVAESDTYIRFEKDKQFEVSDPQKLFSDVSFALLKKDTNNFVLRFDMTFAKPMEKSSILLRTWDPSRNVAEVWYVDALEVMEKETSPPESLNFGTKNESTNTPRTISADQRFVVEKWAGYNAESISDSDLLKVLGIISSQSGEEVNEVTIPAWFKNHVAEWALEGKVSFTEFVDAIEYMYEKRII